MSEVRDRTLWFVVEPPGTILASNGPGHAFVRDALKGRSRVTAKRLFGLDWSTLTVLATRGDAGEPHRGLRVSAEPMFDGEGHTVAMLVRAERDTTEKQSAIGRRTAEWGLARIAGNDLSVRASLDLAESLAKTALPILIVAEEGAGARDLVDAIVAASPLSASPLVWVDARSITSALAQTQELDPILAKSGTLFLDGVEDLSLEAQTELLVALDQGILRDVHLVCSARADLRPLVEASLFRRDLHQVLRAATISLPPLRDRTDKFTLASNILKRFAPSSTLSAAAWSLIEAHPFPGNLPELEAALEHATAIAGNGTVIEPQHLPLEIGRPTGDPQLSAGTKTSAERSAVAEAVRFAGGNMSRAAKRLGVARSTLYRMMERHGLRVS